MRLLRDLRESTKLLILLEITRGSYKTLKPLAEKLDMTVQGLSEYLKIMTKEGLLQNVGGEHRATKKGVETLHENFRLLRDFVESSSKQITLINECTAIAGADIAAGDRVGLFMEEGLLVASPRKKSSSTGIAASPASEGEEVVVRDLEGLMDLKPGRITMLVLPSPSEGGSKKTDYKRARETVRFSKARVVGCLDVVSLVVAHKLKLQVNLEHAVIPGAVEAAERGRNVLILCTQPQIPEILSAIEAANARLEDKIPYEVTSAK